MKKRKHDTGDIWDFRDFDKAISKMHNELDKMFAGLFESARPMLSYGSKQLQKWSGFRMPLSNVHETQNSVIATFELPGVDKRDIGLNVDETSVEVKVKSKLEKEEKKKGFYTYESKAQAFYRKMPLPAEVKPDKAVASYKDGILRVEIPKARPSKVGKGKRVQVK